MTLRTQRTAIAGRWTGERHRPVSDEVSRASRRIPSVTVDAARCAGGLRSPSMSECPPSKPHTWIAAGMGKTTGRWRCDRNGVAAGLTKWNPTTGRQHTRKPKERKWGVEPWTLFGERILDDLIHQSRGRAYEYPSRRQGNSGYSRIRMLYVVLNPSARHSCIWPLRSVTRSDIGLVILR